MKVLKMLPQSSVFVVSGVRLDWIVHAFSVATNIIVNSVQRLNFSQHFTFVHLHTLVSWDGFVSKFLMEDCRFLKEFEKEGFVPSKDIIVVV